VRKDDCIGGRVSHPATHIEVVSLRHPDRGAWQESAPVCKTHGTKREDWEVDGWVVQSIRKRKL